MGTETHRLRSARPVKCLCGKIAVCRDVTSCNCCIQSSSDLAVHGGGCDTMLKPPHLILAPIVEGRGEEASLFDGDADEQNLRRRRFAAIFFVHPNHQSKAAPAVEFTAVPVIKRPRSDAMSAAAFAVSEALAGSFGAFFGANALDALKAGNGPLAGLDVGMRHHDCDWDRPAIPESLVERLTSTGAIIATPTEGALFEYGSDQAIVANLKALCDSGMGARLAAGSVTCADHMRRRMVAERASNWSRGASPASRHSPHRQGSVLPRSSVRCSVIRRFCEFFSISPGIGKRSLAAQHQSGVAFAVGARGRHDGSSRHGEQGVPICASLIRSCA
jgi:hypothetical protein